MNRAFVILTFVLLTAGNVATASATNWFIYAQASNPDGTGAGVYNQFGVKPTALDGLDTSDIASNWVSNTTKVVAQKIDGITTQVYDRNFMSTADFTTYPSQVKSWHFRVAGLSGADTSTPIKLVFRTAPDSSVKNPDPPPGIGACWGLTLVNDHDEVIMKPAWAGGGVWAEHTQIPLNIPTTTDTLFAEFMLPTITLSADTPATMLAEGYEFEFGPIPEPSSLVILSTGLAGLLALTRRRSLRH